MKLDHNILECALRHCPTEGATTTALKGVHLYKFYQENEQPCDFIRPTLGVVLQGSKAVTCGDTTWLYGTGDYLLISLDLPIASFPRQASREHPYVGLAIDLDPAEILEVMNQARMSAPEGEWLESAIGVCTMDAPLSSALGRLLALLDTPEEMAVMAPLLRRELIYRLLAGPRGSGLKRLATGSSRSFVVGAINWLRDHYQEQLKIDALARSLNVSTSSLHHKFKEVTSMSPLQYQKSIRLSQARRLLLEPSLSTADVGFQVGYSSASQFTREYKKTFGIPPSEDRLALRAVLA